MKSDAAIRLEEAAMIVAALARQWRETAETDESGLISRKRVDEIIAMTETTARNLAKIAASRLPEDWSFERRMNREEVKKYILASRERLEEELEDVLDGTSDS